MTSMIIAGCALAALIALMGVSMTVHGDNAVVKTLGSLLLMLAGGLLFYTLGTASGFLPTIDKDKCSQYVWVDDTLTCVPYGEEG